MFIIKNNNLYYYNFKIFRWQLSFFIVPLSIFIIFYYKNILKYLSNIFLFIFFGGSYGSYVMSVNYNLPNIFYSNILLHLSGLYPLIDFKKYFKPNIINYLLGFITILIFIFLPFWPYENSRESFILILITIYIITNILYYILHL